MMEERELLILGQQEHEQLLDEEIAQLKAVLQEKVYFSASNSPQVLRCNL